MKGHQGKNKKLEKQKNKTRLQSNKGRDGEWGLVSGGKVKGTKITVHRAPTRGSGEHGLATWLHLILSAQTVEWKIC